MRSSLSSERQGRLIDHDEIGSMEKKKDQPLQIETLRLERTAAAHRADPTKLAMTAIRLRVSRSFRNQHFFSSYVSRGARGSAVLH
jgi:hypothetical protein